MPGKPRGAVTELIHTLFVVGTVRDLTDGELLERFAADRNGTSEAAFGALVDRHGPMVWRVCRGVLNDPHDAQDAFQATFLVLVRQANGLWVRDSLGPRHQRVALRTAKAARSAAARRRRFERAAAVASIVVYDAPDNDLARLLHEEIDRLPERFRAPIVLCDLDGRTHEQAARQLGWPLGTVKSRIARGRERLRNRLSRHGLVATPAVVETPPAGLVVSTTVLALRSFTSRTLVQGSTAAILAQGVLRSMSISRWIQSAAALCFVTATVVTAPALAQKDGDGKDSRPAEKAENVRAGDVPVAEVKPGKINIQVSDRGVVEAMHAPSVLNPVEGQSRIASILPEGTKVKKGDVVAKLDPAPLMDQLTNQTIAENAARAAYQNAKLTREVAEIALTEYVEGIYKQDLETVEGELLGTQTTLKRAEAKLERTRRARKLMTRVLPPVEESRKPSDIVADLEIDDRLDAAEAAVAREKMGVERAQTRKQVLLKYTKSKVVKELTSEIEKARSSELAKQATWELEKIKTAKLLRQIESCTLVAPDDGKVVYYSRIQEGATVRERQLIFSIPDLSELVVTVKVSETDINKIKAGQKARITVDAFPGKNLTGVVAAVAPLPDTQTFFDGNRKVYTVRIKLDQAPSGMRPGLSASAVIFVGRDVPLRVPVRAVVERVVGPESMTGVVAVKTAAGEFERREVRTAWGDGEFVEIVEGLKAGETVALEPEKILKKPRHGDSWGPKTKKK